MQIEKDVLEHELSRSNNTLKDETLFAEKMMSFPLYLSSIVLRQLAMVFEVTSMRNLVEFPRDLDMKRYFISMYLLMTRESYL